MPKLPEVRAEHTTEYKADLATIERHKDRWIEVGLAIMRVRDTGTYKTVGGYATFASWCNEYLPDMGVRWAQVLVKAARTLPSVAKVTGKRAPSAHGETVEVPAKVAAVLSDVPEDQRQDVIDAATPLAGGTPTVAGIKAAAREIAYRTDPLGPARRGRDVCKELASEVRAVRQKLKGFLETEGGSRVHGQSIAEGFGTILSALKFGIPHATCNCSRGCKACCKRRWLPYGVWKSLDDETREECKTL